MSYSIDGTTIRLTRGDTLRVVIDIYTDDDEPYVPVEGDSMRFAMKKSYRDEEPLLVKDIPMDTRTLHLTPEDTKTLQMPHSYVYDIQLTHSNGDIDTFINKAKIYLTEEVE